MIVYSECKENFLFETPSQIANILENNIYDLLGVVVSEQEKRSWLDSMSHLRQLLSSNLVPNDVGISLEYNIPISGNRIDCILSGKDKNGAFHAIIIEMKGWEIVYKTDIPHAVKTLLSGDINFTSHPSAQAKWYSDMLFDYESIVQDEELMVHPCAYLYNCISKDIINDEFYEDVTVDAPPFCKDEENELLDFIASNIVFGDDYESIKKLETSKIRVSKRLVDSIAKLRSREAFFRLSPEQSVAYYRILRAVSYHEKENNRKIVLLLHGGPGTGKSVIAINVVFELLTRYGNIDADCRVRYITKTKPPRYLLRDAMTDISVSSSAISNTIAYPNRALFSKSMHVSVVDEAHRLVPDRYDGDQVNLIIENSDISVFFIDDRQRISVNDIGTEQHIKDIALIYKASFKDLGYLKSQFRSCITDWILSLLQYDGASNRSLPPIEEYDLRLYEDISDMYHEIVCKNQEAGVKARLVAGYTREWKSKKNPSDFDWIIPSQKKGELKLKWNLDCKENWATKQGVDYVGCIHTCQGMEFDYIGVILGNDITCSPNGNVEFRPENHSKDDPAIPKKYCIPILNLGELASQIVDLIRNAYYVLMSRGMRGCYLYVEDPGMRTYIKNIVGKERIY